MKNNYFDSISKIILIDIKLSKHSFFSKLHFLFLIFFFFFSLTTTYAQCNVVKNGTFTGNANNWTTQSLLTGWHYNAFFPNEIYTEVDGASSNNVSLKQSLVGLIVDPSTNSLTVSFKIKGQNAGRLNCNTTGELSLKIGNLTYMTIKNIANNTQIFSTDITVDNGATLLSTPGFPLTVGRALTEPPITLTQGTINLRIPWTSGMPNADLEFLALSSNTTYSTSCGAGGGDDWILDDISVIASNPTAFAMTGSSVCVGSSTTIGLNGSQVGVSYQLQRGGSNVGAAVPGTGSAISFGSHSTVGVYTVVATAGTTTCVTTMSDVKINPVPTVANAGNDQNGSCGSTSTTLAANTPTVGTGVWSIVSGSGGVITNSSSPTSTFTGTAGTTYTLRWTISNSPCPASIDDVVIKFNQNPVVSITGNTYICASTTTTLSPTSGGTWTSNNPSVATVTNAGVVTGVASGSATFTFTSNTAPNCSAITAAVTVSTALSTTYNSSGSFTVPAGVTSIQVEAWGGGGSGGGSTSNNVKGGAGGAGGAYIMATIPVSAGNYIVTVGGVRSGTTSAGTQGNPSWFGSINTIYAEGGAGGSAPNNTIVSGGIGSVSNTSSNGTLITKLAGSNGSNGTTTIGGAGGNGANTSTPEGLGGGQRTTENNGNAGVAPGGGGGGAFLPDNTDHTGGDGGAGRVIITISNPTATAGGSAILCQAGTATTISGASATNGTILWTHNGTGALSNTTTVAPTYTSAVGDIGKTVTLTMTVSNGPCVTSATATYTISVNNVVAPAAIVKDQPNCSVLTGSVDLSNLPATGTWTVNVSPVTSNLTGLTGTDSAITTITGLTAGTNYTFTVTQGSCTSTASNNVSIAAPPVIAKWNGTSWSSTPTITTRVEFNGIYTSATNIHANVNACSCYVNNGAVVTFNKGNTLNVINEVQVLSGSLTFEDQASLVQHKDVPFQPNFGQITYKRNTTITRYDYTYWSSPVKDRTLKQLSYYTLFDRYFSYNNGWVLSYNGQAKMEAGHGYIIRGPQNSSITVPTLFKGIFEGEFHNGVYNGADLAVVPNIDYLLGNPYPSAIDADKFIDANATRLQGTLYFWTHNTEPVAASGTTTYKYTASDYASYNRTGGVGTAGIGVEAVSKGKIPTGKIAAGQGFFARAIGTGNVLFNNSMRLAASPTDYLDNAQFFKLSSNAKTTSTATNTTEKSRVWLNLTNTEGAFKQLLVGYITGATNEYDNGFDGVTYNGNQYVDFYSIIDDKNLVIQGRALPFVKKDSVALGYNTTIKGDFQISIDQVDGIFTTQNVLLEDKELKVQHDLKKEAYTFSTEKGTFNNRFVLRYVDKNVPDEIIIPEIPVALNKGLIVSVQDKKIKISSTLAALESVILYDVAGRKLFQKNKLNTNQLLVSNVIWNHHVLIVDVVLTDGTKHSRKIIN